MKPITACLGVLLFSLLPCLRADTTIDPERSFAYGANIGWIDTRGNVSTGAVVGEFICSGSMYSANVGWISLGNGTPANGIRYQNNSGTDWGVNTQDYASTGGSAEAKLRGSAYGANVGWIQFENIGNPRVDLATGQLLGYAYGSNIGWISLAGLDVNVKTKSIAPGTDGDGDGIADAWELLHAQNLTLLTNHHDQDGDGVPDQDEYGADTDPLNGEDALRITAFIPPRQLVIGGPFLTDLTWTSKPTRRYTIEINPDLLSPWTPYLDPILPAMGATTTRSFTDLQETKRFYRLRARLPLGL